LQIKILYFQHFALFEYKRTFVNKDYDNKIKEETMSIEVILE